MLLIQVFIAGTFCIDIIDHLSIFIIFKGLNSSRNESSEHLKVLQSFGMGS